MADQAAILVPRRQNSKIGDIVIDVAVSEHHSMGADITDRPVEDGADVSDGVLQRPDEVTLEVLWTDVPGGDGLAVADRSKRIWQQLRELKESGQPVDVLTSLRSYSNVVITSIETRKDRRTGFTVPASVTLRQVKIASQETIQVPPAFVAKKQRPGAGKESDEGRRQTTKPDEATAQKASYLHKMFY